MDNFFCRNKPPNRTKHYPPATRCFPASLKIPESVLPLPCHPAHLYLPDDKEDADEPETKPGLNCIIEDLSDGGCALIIGGKTAPGLRIKVQFELSGNPLTMHGVVRSVDYHEARNRSVLHVEADRLPLETRNSILAEVFGMTDDEAPPPEENNRPAVDTAERRK